MCVRARVRAFVLHALARAMASCLSPTKKPQIRNIQRCMDVWTRDCCSIVLVADI
jgi:hypothetical protein